MREEYERGIQERNTSEGYGSGMEKWEGGDLEQYCASERVRPNTINSLNSLFDRCV